MKIYYLFFLVALVSAQEEATTTTTTTTTTTNSSLTLGGLLGTVNRTASNVITGHQQRAGKVIEIGNFTAHSIVNLGSQAMGNASDFAQKGVDVAHNMIRESFNVGRQINNMTRDFMEMLPIIPSGIISNATNFGINVGEKTANMTMSLIKAGIKTGNSVGQSMTDFTGSAISAVNNQVSKIHNTATDFAKGKFSNVTKGISNRFVGLGSILSRFGKHIETTSTMTK